MTKIVDWLKKNWMVLGLLMVVLYLLAKNSLDRVSSRSYSPSYGIGGGSSVGMPEQALSKSMIANDSSIVPDAAPVASEERLVIQETDISLLVKDAAEAIKVIEKTAVSFGGYLVNRSLNQPEGAATGYISIRVPVEKKDETLGEIRKSGVKVIQENVSGFDVTDQYVDIQERLNQLEKTKSRIQVIMEQATRVSDLLDAQNQLNSIQRQIDSYKGRQKYLEQTAKLTLITVNLSTDELALPYTPDQAWRPEVVFKNAVRSMIGLLRSVADIIIWLVVFIPMFALAILVVWLAGQLKKRWIK